MKKEQRFELTVDEEEFVVSVYAVSASSRVRIVINEDEFILPPKRFGFLTGRREIFRLGERQCILVISRTGKADIVFNGTYVKSGEPYVKTTV